jgi:hypothetical protein
MSKSHFNSMKSPDVTPLVPPTGTKVGNFSTWNADILKSKEFAKLLGKGMILFITGNEAVPKPITEDMWANAPLVPGAEPAVLPAALATKRREQCYNRYDSEKADIAKQYESVFWMLYGTLSEESKNKIKILAGEAWMTIQTDCNTRRLYELIKESHFTHAFGAGNVNALLNQAALSAQMISLQQNDLTLAEFATLFREIRSACIVGGVPEVTEAADTIQFILKLDSSSYGPMHQDMAKKAARNDPDSYPNTIDKAVAIAQSWHVTDFLQPHQALKTVAKKDESPPRYRIETRRAKMELNSAERNNKSEYE